MIPEPSNAELIGAGDPAERGHVIWYCSEEDGGPDVGLSLGLGDGGTLWIGEMPNSTLRDHGIDPRKDDGWWLVLYDNMDTKIVGRVDDSDGFARDLIERLAAALKDRAVDGSGQQP